MLFGGCYLGLGPGFVDTGPVHIGGMTVDCEPGMNEDKLFFQAETVGDEMAVYVDIDREQSSLGLTELIETEEGIWQRRKTAEELGTSCAEFEVLLFTFVVEGANGTVEERTL